MQLKWLGEGCLRPFSTYLTEIEAIINARTLAYLDKELDNQIITPAHFLSINIKTGIPVLTVKNDNEKIDPSYHVEEMNTAEKLLGSWNKGQRRLE